MVIGRCNGRADLPLLQIVMRSMESRTCEQWTVPVPVITGADTQDFSQLG